MRVGSVALGLTSTIAHDSVQETFPRERPSMRWLFAGRSWRGGSPTQEGATTTYVVTPSAGLPSGHGVNLRMYPGPCRPPATKRWPLCHSIAAGSGTENTFLATPSLMVDTWPPNSSVT